ncbi:MAG: DUF2892 domain-containing protein [Melioribacteraceae bacterium]|nr:DUF2892 domain-containing protein [Melioribacteraceae bacterium]
MKKNVGGVDKTLRIFVGILIIAAGLYYQNWWGVIGVVLLLTGLINRCPLYLPLGLSTCKKDVVKE